MNEKARQARNKQRLEEECFPAFGAAVRRTLDRLEAQGFKPRIQDAFRTEAAQLEAFNNGFSKVKFGFHNVAGADGRFEALACDVLDEDHIEAPPTRYLLALTLAARAEGLDTLIMMNLDPAEEAAVEAVLATGDIERPVRVGDDPTHVEPTGITIKQAKNGARPGDLSASHTEDEEGEDMPLNKDDLKEIETVVRKLLDEGTGKGQDTWAKTSKLLLATVQRLVNEVSGLQKEVTALKKKVG
jgi:hypothetical protein